MILPKKVFRPLALPLGLILFLNRVLLGGIMGSLSRENNDRDSSLGFFPSLKTGPDGKKSCISCGLCITVCPTQCLSLKGEYGAAPTEFIVETYSCVSCQLCKQVCPVDAIESTPLKEMAFSQNQRFLI